MESASWVRKIHIIPIFTLLIALFVAITSSILFGPSHESFALASTTTTLASSANPSVSGQSVTFTATVAPVPPGTGMPSGTVTFTIDGVASTPVTLSMRHATLSSSTLPVGTHKITAQYSGNAKFLTSKSHMLTQTVNKASTATTLTSSPNPSVSGQKITFSASAAAVSPGAGMPTGNVTFTIDGTAQPAVTLVSGQANLSSSTLPIGTHNVTAQYSGDVNFATSTSSTLAQTVNMVSTLVNITLHHPGTCINGSPCQFNPKNVTISSGSTVKWTNIDTITHTVTSDTSIFSSSVSAGKSFSFTFPNTGTFTYHCMIHPFMTGQVVVK